MADGDPGGRLEQQGTEAPTEGGSMQLRVDALTAFLSDHCKDGLGEGHPLASCPGSGRQPPPPQQQQQQQQSGRQLTPKHVRSLTSIVRHQLLGPEENLLSASAFEHLVLTRRNQTSHGEEAAAVNRLREICGLARMRAGPGWRGSRSVRQQAGKGQSAPALAKEQQQQQQQQQHFAEADPRCESGDSPRLGPAPEPGGTLGPCRPPAIPAAADDDDDDGPRRKRSKTGSPLCHSDPSCQRQCQRDTTSPDRHIGLQERKRHQGGPAQGSTTGAELKEEEEEEEEEGGGGEEEGEEDGRPTRPTTQPRPVVCQNLKSSEVRRYDSINDAAGKLGMGWQKIKRLCKENYVDNGWSFSFGLHCSRSEDDSADEESEGSEEESEGSEAEAEQAPQQCLRHLQCIRPRKHPGFCKLVDEAGVALVVKRNLLPVPTWARSGVAGGQLHTFSAHGTKSQTEEEILRAGDEGKESDPDEPAYNYYIAINDETPAGICEMLQSNLDDMLALNRERYPGLTPGCRLRHGTNLWLPRSPVAAATEVEYQLSRVLRMQPRNRRYEVLWADGSRTDEPWVSLQDTVALREFEERQCALQVGAAAADEEDAGSAEGIRSVSRSGRRASRARQQLRRLIIESSAHWIVAAAGGGSTSCASQPQDQTQDPLQRQEDVLHVALRPILTLPKQDEIASLIIAAGFVQAAQLSVVFPFFGASSHDDVSQLVFGLGSTQVLSVAYAEFRPEQSLISVHALRAGGSCAAQRQFRLATLYGLRHGLGMDVVVEMKKDHIALHEAGADGAKRLRQCRDGEVHRLTQLVQKHFVDTVWTTVVATDATLQILCSSSSDVHQQSQLQSPTSSVASSKRAAASSSAGNAPCCAPRKKQRRQVDAQRERNRYQGVRREMALFRASYGDTQGGLFNTEEEAAQEYDRMARQMTTEGLPPLNFPRCGEVGLGSAIATCDDGACAKQHSVRRRKPTDVCLRATVHVDLSDEIRHNFRQSKYQFGRVAWKRQCDYPLDDLSSRKQLAQHATEELCCINKHLADGGTTELCSFKPMQLETIVACAQTESGALSNVVLHLETGGGKSLVYFVLARMLARIVIVVQPLRRLKLEQKVRATQFGCNAVLLEGGKGKETASIMQAIIDRRGEAGQCNILFLTPVRSLFP
jgi:hypothetical protein